MPKITRLPDGTYETRISVIDPRTGKRHQPRVRARSKRELEREIAEARVTIQRGELMATDQTLFRDWCAEWLKTYHPPASSSVRNRRICLKRIQDHEIADIRLGRLTTHDIQLFMNDLQSEKLSANYIRQIREVLSMVLDYTVDVAKVIPASPMRGVTATGIPPATMHVWDKPEVQKFLVACEKRRFTAAWTLAVVLALRIGEIVALRWPEVNLKTGRITICRTISRDENGHRYIKDGVKSPTGRRTLILPPQCLSALIAHKADSDMRRKALGDLWSDDDAVFDDNTGAYLTSDAPLRREYERICASVKDLPRIRPHDLRHTAATAMLRAGIPIQTVSQILGHANAHITLKVYAWVLDAMAEEAAVTIGTMYE